MPESVPTLHALFESQATRAPDAIAAAYGAERLTYGALDERANRLAHLLRSRGVCPETPVGLCLERGLDPIVAILGILKAGGAYVPIDPVYPPDRRSFIVGDSGARIVVSARSLAGAFDAPSTLCLDDDATRLVLATMPSTSPRVPLSPANLAYIIYTSGSTGRPKGSAIPHANVVRLLRAAEPLYGFGEDDCWTVFHSFAFDFSVWEVWGALLYGGRAVVVPYATSRSPAEFLSLLASERVTVLNQTPSAFRQLMLEALAAHADNRLPPLALRWITFGGEALDLRKVQPWFELFGDARPRLVNMYGITETTVHVTHRPVSLEDTKSSASLIGAPLSDMSLHILDREMEPVNAGEAGEMYVGGAGSSRCYVGRPDLTAERFVPDPFSSTPGARLYRTGDLARRNASGDVEYLGRADFQVKLRGFRIELGEIEAAILAIPGVKDAAVTVREDIGGEARLVAYAVGESGAHGFENVKDALKRALPEYMVPSAFVSLAALPLTPNGKLDRAALPAPQIVSTNAYEPPRDATEQAIASVWGEILGVERVGRRDDFFELGGTSLTATRVLARIWQAFGVLLTFQDIFAGRTIPAFAARFEAAKEGVSLEPGAVPRAPRDAKLPLSFSQERIWFHEQLYPTSRAYYAQSTLRMRGRLDREALDRTLTEIVRRHEILRSTFPAAGGEPHAVVHPPFEVRVPVEDVRGGEEELARLVREEFALTFVVTELPLIRWKLLRVADDDHVLTQAQHHLVHDGWSDNVLLGEMLALYEAFAAGHPSPLPEPPIQFSDFAYWQRQWLTGPQGRRQVEYWKRRLEGAPRVLEIPTDRPRPHVQTFVGKTLDRPLGDETLRSVRELSAANGVTAFATLFTAYAILLHKYTGVEEMVVGTTVANRRLPEAEGLIGMIVNNVAVRCDLRGSPTVVEAITRIQSELTAAQSNQDVPFQWVVRALDPERDPSQNPVFQTDFSAHDSAMPPLRAPGLTLDLCQGLSNRSAKFDLSLMLMQRPNAGEQSFCLLWQYNTDLLDDDTVEATADHFDTLLTEMLEDPRRLIRDLTPLTPRARHRVVHELNATSVAYPRDSTLHELLEQQAARTPDAPALTWQARSVNYRQLNGWANATAERLRQSGVRARELVGLGVDDPIARTVGMLAILKSGAAYVPVDGDLPEDRVTRLLARSGARHWLTDRAIRVPGVRPSSVELDPARSGTPNPRQVAGPEDLAYVLYTSGSTGEPKGVMVPHRALVNHMAWMNRAFPLANDDVVLQRTPIGFDASVWELWAPLLSGARVALTSPGAHRECAELVGVIRRERVTVMQGVPTFYRMLLVTPGVDRCKSLRRVFSGGEQLSSELAGALAETLGARVINLYGPTETAIDATFHEWKPSRTASAVPIGLPVDNVRAHVVDRWYEPVPPGVVGELWVAGEGLAHGYLGDAALTAARFVPDPFGPPGSRSYRTGDRVRRLGSGAIEFVGRVDHQVKVRGYRIEIGEIEATLLRHGVRDCVVVVHGDATTGARLVAYVVGGAETQDLRETLKASLPEYMVPSVVVPLEALPLTTSGKVDRLALPAPDESARASDYVAPRSKVEELLCELWAELLGVSRVGIRDDFFELGGHSLLAIQIVARMRDRVGVELPVRVFFESPTVEELAESVRAALGERRQS